MFLKKTQKLTELRIKQSIMEEEKHEPWRKHVLGQLNTDRLEASEKLDSPDSHEDPNHSNHT